MKFTILASLLAVLTVATIQTEDDKKDNANNDPKRIEVSQLTPEFDDNEVIIRFEVAKTYWISGTVPKGQSRSFGIEAVTNAQEPRFSVLVIGELANAMERFGYAPPQSGDPARGLNIEARGKIKVYPAPKSAPEKGPSYEFRIADLSGFRITSPLIAKGRHNETLNRSGEACRFLIS